MMCNHRAPPPDTHTHVAVCVVAVCVGDVHTYAHRHGLLALRQVKQTIHTCWIQGGEGGKDATIVRMGYGRDRRKGDWTVRDYAGGKKVPQPIYIHELAHIHWLLQKNRDKRRSYGMKRTVGGEGSDEGGDTNVRRKAIHPLYRYETVRIYVGSQRRGGGQAAGSTVVEDEGNKWKEGSGGSKCQEPSGMRMMMVMMTSAMYMMRRMVVSVSFVDE